MRYDGFRRAGQNHDNRVFSIRQVIFTARKNSLGTGDVERAPGAVSARCVFIYKKRF